MMKLLSLISSSVRRCKIYALTIFSTYCISCITGIAMSHSGNSVALSCRDRIVGNAVKTDEASISYQAGNNFSAAIYDFTGNLFFVAIPQTIMGLTIVIPYFTTAAQGWIGGIVSVDAAHNSRLKHVKSSLYYLLVLLLQFISFSLSIGAGIKCGVDFYNANRLTGWEFRRYRIPKASLIDLGMVYAVAIPLFFLASCFEFFSAWNV